MDDEVLKQENNHLEETLKKVSNAKVALNKAMSQLGAENVDQLQELRDNPETSGADFMMYVQQLHEKNESFNIKDKVKRLDEYEYLLKEPYFARIDLKDVSSPQNLPEEPIYIGKFGYTENVPVVTDWRAKVSSIFYRYRFPQKNVKYIAPSGEITKDLTLKRTFEIDNGSLIKYFNNDIQLDEGQIISDKITGRTGGVLEDIIETIQESQLDIIEADPREICIVQGCVGSGKSTVAIHKLSHIFFNYPELIQPERSILIAKSGVLVSYLATLFPKLGIFDINYKNLRELIVNIIFREDLGVKFDLDSNDDLSDFNKKEIDKLRSDIENIHLKYEQSISKLAMQEDFASLSSFVYNPNQSTFENINDFIEDLNEEMVYEKEKLKDNPNMTKAWIYKDNIKNLRKLITKLQKIKRDIKDKDLKEICNIWNINLNKTLGYKDALIYLYIYSDLIGFGEKTLRYQYCVVDEGQDLNGLEYLLLGRLVMNGRFCILGDLNQSILEEGLTDWSSIKHSISDAHKAQTFQLDTNYRSTMQIIDFANKILTPFTKDYLPKSINRVGSEVIVNNSVNRALMLDDFQSELSKDLQDLNTSIGIIVYDQELLEDVKSKVYNLQEVHNISKEQIIELDEHKRINYIPKGVYVTLFDHCKGLEFSKVYILGLDTKKVSNYGEAKKAFVATTRAMNDLVLYTY